MKTAEYVRLAFLFFFKT